MEKQKLIKKIRNGKEEGFTLLEYVAGAAVILSVVMIGLNAMGGGLSAFFTNVGTWAGAVTPVNPTP